MTNLTRLDLDNNSISDISALSNLTSLEALWLYNNNISDISALSNLTSLEALWLYNNNISDISALSNLTNLTRLDLDNNSISDISALSTLTNLQWLYLDYNSISNISALSTLTNLRGLTLDGNSISEISALSTLTNLGWLELSGNSISDISALSTLINLIGLNLNDNSISAISALSTLTNLQWLLLDYNSISDISAISALSTLTNLITLTLNDNSISDISAISALSTLTNLTRLYLDNNSISAISALSTLTNLRSLSLSGNSISEISALSTLTNLGWLELSGNPLSSTSINTHIPTLERRGVIVIFDSSSGPDLIVESPSVSDNTLTSGQSFTLNARVRNQGNGQSAATTLQYYRSANATITSSDSPVGSDSVNGLSASGTSAESISLTAPSSAGTYYYGACVASVSGESDANNNCSTSVLVTVSSSGSPDLIVESPSVSDSTLTTGQSFTLNVRVRNQGNGQSAATTLQYYRSTNTTITSSDSPVGSDSVNGLSASGTSAESISLTAPSSAGTYYYGACVASVSGESDANNNCSTSVLVTVSSSGSPDLIVESPSVSDSTLTTGQSFTLNARVRNQGNGQSAATTLQYYRSTNATITTGDTQVGTDPVSGLSASGTSAESISLTAPSSAGTYYYGACVASVSGESDTNNNCSTSVLVTVSSSGSPDLIVESPSVSDSTLTTGQSFTLSVTVRNQGNGQSAATTLQYYRSTNATITTGDTQVGTDPVSVLSASGTSAESISLTAPSSAGTYYYGACVASVSGESDANNNCSTSVLVTVSSSGSPDLIVESPSVSDSTLTTGQSFTLNARVRNQGNGQSAATTLQYYRSTNATISTGDTQVGTDSVSVLSASGTSAESISLTAPSSAGTYYYGACVASVSGESDANNNCSTSVSVTVSSSSGGGNTYGVGESLPNFPSGIFFPIQLISANLSFGTGQAVLSFNNGGVMVLQDSTTYTCIASEGCGVEAGRVTSGTISVITGPSVDSSSPDLIVESPSVSDNTLTTGQSFTLSVTVRNQGTGQSAVTTLQYYRSTNATITSSDSPVGSDSVNGLSASGTSAESISLTAPSSAGTYYYGACVASVSGESDTNNNCSSGVSVTVSSSSPDLIVESPSVSDSTLTTGQSFTLSVTVRNQGNGQSAATTLRYYRSMDATITSSDSLVGSNSVSSLLAGSTSLKSISLSAPSNAGTYYYGACVTSVSGESNTNNNCSSGVSVTVTIDPPPPPDEIDPPPPPTNVTYQLMNSEYWISWDPSLGATRYEIYFQALPFGNPSFSDNMEPIWVTAETTYKYDDYQGENVGCWVKACNAAGCSDHVKAERK